jgi:hypothetical protein
MMSHLSNHYKLRSQTTKSIRISNIRGWTLAGFAIIIAFFAIFVQQRINENDRVHFTKLNMLSDFAAKHFGTAIYICIVSLFLVWLISTFDWMRKPQVGRDLLELANVKRTRFAFFYTASGLVFGAATLYIFSAAGSTLWNTIIDLVKILFS